MSSRNYNPLSARRVKRSLLPVNAIVAGIYRSKRGDPGAVTARGTPMAGREPLGVSRSASRYSECSRAGPICRGRSRRNLGSEGPRALVEAETRVRFSHPDFSARNEVTSAEAGRRDRATRDERQRVSQSGSILAPGPSRRSRPAIFGGSRSNQNPWNESQRRASTGVRSSPIPRKSASRADNWTITLSIGCGSYRGCKPSASRQPRERGTRPIR
jgi:hypothetical protein